MITGVHALLYSKHAEKVQAGLGDVFGWSSVDAGGEARHELWLVCDDVRTTAIELAERGIESSAIIDRGWGLVTTLAFPGGETIGLYKPQHPSPLKN